MALAPADGGRRSRRGFAYQDVVTLLDCLDMLDGQWTSVSWEDLEDILCYRDGAPNYRQVKTIPAQRGQRLQAGNSAEDGGDELSRQVVSWQASSG
jgi:hypothetical protein